MILFFALVVPAVLTEAGPEQERQEADQQPIVEKVTVTNVEVPVRVLFKGKPVTDLTRTNFTLYENKKEMDINGFFLKKKKITLPLGQDNQGQPLPPAAPRTFVLVFSITDFNTNLEKAVEHLFAHVLQPADRLLIFANDQTTEFPILKNMESIKKRLLEDLNGESKKARERLAMYINKVETFLNIHDFRRQLHIRRDFPGDRLVDFLKKYLLTWNDYKKKYLTPSIDRFYFFSRYLEKLKGDKWVLNFYQLELFPNIRIASSTMDIIRDLAERLIDSREAGDNAMGKMILTLLNQIMVDLNVSKDFPTEEISKLFYKVDATFHSFFIRGTRKTGLDDVETQEVVSDVEKTLKEITDITGGRSITSNDLVSSIDAITGIEDAYYILTYVPQDPEKAGKIKIKVDNKKYDVLYDDNFRVDYIGEYLKKLEAEIKTPDVKIDKVSFKEKLLAFTVKGYLMKEINNKPGAVGQIKIRIRLVNSADNSSLFDQARVLTAQKNELSISLPAFKSLQKGEYNFIIDAVDMLTGKEITSNYNVNVKR